MKKRTEIKADAVSAMVMKKNTAGQLWRLSYPTMIAVAMQTMYDLVDMAWIGQLSEAALSGTTLFGAIYMLFTVLNEVAGAGSVSMIAQSFGRKDFDATRRVSEQTISFKIILACISGLLLAVFLVPLLHFYTSDIPVIEAALEYGWLRLFFIPVMFSSYSVNTIFRCTGDSKTPMRIMLLSAVINIVLDPILIFPVIPGTAIPGFGLGVFGASLATVIAASISFLYGFILLLRGRAPITITIRGLFRLDKKIDIDLLKIGLPSGFNMLVRSFFRAILIKFVASYGRSAIALAGVGGRLAGFAFMPIFGFGMGGSTLVGHSLGRENIEEARRVAKLSALMSFAVVGTAGIFAWIFPTQILSLFIKDMETRILGVPMIRLFFLSFIPLAVGMGLGVVFSGSGHNSPKLIATIISRWLVQLSMLVISVSVLHLPLTAVWFSFVGAECSEFLILFYHYKKGVWKTKRV